MRKRLSKTNKNIMNSLNLEKHYQEAHKYINHLAEQLGHPEEKQRALIIWKAVMHTIRGRIQISESLDLISQFPLFLKGMYVDQWKYHEKPPKDYDTVEQMKNMVKNLQSRYGEAEFNWDMPTEEIIATTLDSLKEYVSEGQMAHIKGQMPAEVKSVFG